MQAEFLALELLGTDSRYANAMELDSKMDSLRYLLPGVDICRLVQQDIETLSTELGTAACRMISLSRLLGGTDVGKLISRKPVLLYAEVRSIWIQKLQGHNASFLETFHKSICLHA